MMYRKNDNRSKDELLLEIERLRTQLTEAEETLNAIRSGEVDALVVPGETGEQVFTLKGAEHPYRVFIEKMQEGAVALAADGTILYCNSGFSQIVRKPIENIIGSGISQFVSTDSGKRFEKMLGRGKTSSSQGEIELLAGDGTIIVPAHLSINPMHAVNEWAMYTVVSDLTGIKKTEDALRRARDEMEKRVIERTAELEFSNIILSTQQETSLDGILVVDDNGRIISFNQHFIDMWNIPPEVIETRSDKSALQSMFDKLVDPIAFLNRVEYLYNHRDEKSNEEMFLKGGRIIDRYSAPVLGSDGKYYGRVWYFRDITVRRRALDAMNKYAEELKRSNDLKDIFTDILRHDLLNPASIVQGYTEVLLDMEGDEKKLKSLKAIERNIWRVIDLMEAASRFAMLESVEELEFKEMDIGAIFKEVVENFRSTFEEKKMVIEFAADGSYPSKVSPIIEEVFANLLSNAIKYSPEKSRIIIDITDAGEDWKVSVTDSGEGISDEDKPKVFERFKRVEKGAVKGTGLGLAIVKRLIILHGGTFGIGDNPAGQGSVFWVTVKKA
ncbi:MAG: PAS domain-containing sensor histidine kinase [Methanosarcinaceae archaeon]|nr:PAS domain-containing sensor histidine kinase [Methanosarcinaceae archaeon]